MSKERELEIYEILLKHLTWSDTKGAKKGARALINLGYTKQQFGVWELKAWLEKKMKSLNAPCSTIANTEYLAFQEVLDKIREIEEKLAKEGR